MAEREDCGHVFISYLREDADRVNYLQDRLQRAGIPVWRDIKDLWPGEMWKRRLRDEIGKNSLAFMPCFSRNLSNRARSIMYEELIWASEEYRMRDPDVPWIFPVLFEKCTLPTVDLGNGMTLNDLQWVQLFENQERELERLIAALKGLFTESSTTRQPPQSTAMHNEGFRGTRDSPPHTSDDRPHNRRNRRRILVEAAAGLVAAALSVVLYITSNTSGGAARIPEGSGRQSSSASQLVPVTVPLFPPVNLADCPDLTEGYHGSCVAQLQTLLDVEDGTDLPVNGQFDSDTKQAVIAFQVKHHIVPANGIVGLQTKQALKNQIR